MGFEPKPLNAENLYTKKFWLYHFVFFRVLRYDKGVAAFFKQSGYLRPSMKVLDAGCGSGLVTKVLYKDAKTKRLNNLAFDAFDITNSMLDSFKKWLNSQGVENIQVRRADVTQLKRLPADWNGYDLIVTSGLLEYIPKTEIKQALHNLKKLLKNDGSILIFLTRSSGLTSLLVEKWWQANAYKQDEITSLVQSCGFQGVKYRQFPAPYGYLNSGMFIIEISQTLNA